MLQQYKLIAHVMCMSVAAQLGIDLIWPEITNSPVVNYKGQLFSLPFNVHLQPDVGRGDA